MASTTYLPRLRRDETVLLVVDVQERLMPLIFEAERVVRNCAVLVRAAGVLGLPVVATEQNPGKLGATVPEVASVLSETGAGGPLAKMLFSACTDGVVAALERHGRRSVLLCGVEAHVCVMQTALDLVERGFTVFVAENAISSRYEADKRVGYERMRLAGALPTSTESAIFEMLREAGTAEFRALLPLVK